MNLLARLTGRKGDEPTMFAELRLVPESLPPHLATYAHALSYRSELSELYEHTSPGDGARARLGQQLRQLDMLLQRQQLVEKMRGAWAQRESDQASAQSRLAQASKAVAAAEAAHRDAIDKHAAVEKRLAELQAAQRVFDQERADEIEAARLRLDAAVQAGDQAEEEAASRDVAALQAGQLSPSAEAAAVALRIERTTAHLAALHDQQVDAVAGLVGAQRAQVTAQIDLAKLQADQALDQYAFGMLGVFRALAAAQRLGFADISNSLLSVSEAKAWAGDCARTWFDALDARVVTGPVHLGRVLSLVAAALDGPPLDLDLLRQDLRPASSTLAALAE